MGELRRLVSPRSRHLELSGLVANGRRLFGNTRRSYLKRMAGEDSSLIAEAEALLAELEVDGDRLDRGVDREAAGVLAELDLAAVPARLGTYRIDGVLARGGMGVIYRATDEALARPVAIKTVPLAVGAKATAFRRLEREARLMAAISHPNVATIHALHVEDGRAYLVLELLTGRSLRAVIGAEAPQPLARALAYVRDAARGVGAAHRRGIVHGDLKPANIQITGEGLVKVIDFGIGHAIGEMRRHDHAGLKRSGGTPDFMSPEQVVSGTAGPASDVWSLACILYECIAGRRLWPRGSVADTLRAIVTSEADLSGLPLGLPPDIVGLLRSSVAREPSSRPRSMDDVATRLERALYSL